jgi:DNA-binding protein Fis
MVFVDGENLAIRYGASLPETAGVPPHVTFEQDVFVWSSAFDNVCLDGSVFRKYYYTSVQGDENLVTSVEDKLKKLGFEAPKVLAACGGNKSHAARALGISRTTLRKKLTA